MAEKIKVENVEQVVVENNSGVSELQGTVDFFKKYQNYIYGIVIAGLLGFLAFTFLRKKVDATKDLKAYAQMQYANEQRSRDSFNVALNGDANGPGLLTIISKNGGTVTANEARLEAAKCYLSTDRPKEALKLLEKATGFGKQIDAKRLNLIGDCKGEIANESGTMNAKLGAEAIEYYEKAGNSFPEDPIAAYYFFKAAQMSEKIGKNEDAIKTYKMIKEKYPENTQVLRDVEKYLGKLGVLD
jgi:tetratricopeptide (TPR) repeat protein